MITFISAAGRMGGPAAVISTASHMGSEREIGPGLLPPSAALALTAAAASSFDTQRVLQSIPPDRETEIPVKLTGGGSDGKCSWVERAWQSDGSRYDKPNGRSGTTSFRPAMLIGNGSLPPASFPIDTYGRLTIVADTLDQVLEVVWNCACAVGGSGAGSGGGSTNVATDCGDISTVLTVSLTVIAGTLDCADGVSFDLEWDGEEWTGSAEFCGQTLTGHWNCGAPTFDSVGAGDTFTLAGYGGVGPLPLSLNFGWSGDPAVNVSGTLTEG